MTVSYLGEDIGQFRMHFSTQGSPGHVDKCVPVNLLLNFDLLEDFTEFEPTFIAQQTEREAIEAAERDAKKKAAAAAKAAAKAAAEAAAPTPPAEEA